MPVSTFPAAPSGLTSIVKSVQRGSAAGAGTVTITAVDTTKSFVNVFGTASSGTVAGSGTISALNATVGSASSNSNAGGWLNGTVNGGLGGPNSTNATINSRSFSGNTMNLSGGSNNLVAAVVQGYLSGATSLVVSGACRWEVVEFN